MQPRRAWRSVVRAWTARTRPTACSVGSEMSKGVSSPEPSDTTAETRSGRRRARALAKGPPRRGAAMAGPGAVPADGDPVAARLRHALDARLEPIERAVGAVDVPADARRVRAVV